MLNRILYYTRSKFFPGVRLLLLILLTMSGLLLDSCKKDHYFDFLKSTGKIITVQRPITGDFTAVKLENNIDLVLTQGPSYSITIEGGENLLPGIDSEIKDSILTFRNNNTFNWVRSYDKKITARVTAPHFLRILYESTGTLTNTDTIHEDSIFVQSYGGSGYIILCIKANTSHLALTRGSADLNISGISGSNFIFAGSYGPFRCQELHTLNTYMNNSGTNDCYINVANHLEYEIKGLGNIYYAGHPPQISGTITGAGKLIPLD